jgi:hypothetical protein
MRAHPELQSIPAEQFLAVLRFEQRNKLAELPGELVKGRSGCFRLNLRRLLRSGKVAGIKAGQVWLFSPVCLSAYIQQTEEVAANCRP